MGDLPFSEREKPIPATRTSKKNPIIRVRHPQSSKNGIILFIGEQRGGKTSTINTLFGTSTKPVVSPPSPEIGTTEILELKTESPVSNLRILDVPGLGAADSLEWDAQILASLKKYMDVDPDLERSIPHMVILVTRFDRPENSLYNPDSRFIRTLNALNLLKGRLLDKYNPNLIIVCTRFMSGKRRYRIVPQPYLEKIKDVVRSSLELTYDPYTVLAENRPETWNLNQVGDSWHLSNGDFYPANLIEALLDVSKMSKSLIGFEYFRQVMETRRNLVFKSPVAVPMVDPDRRRFQKFYQALVYQIELAKTMV